MARESVDPQNGLEWTESLYEKLANDDDGRVCEGIRDEACQVVPGNFFRTLCATALTSIGDRIANAKTTLPWLLAHLGAPAWCLSLLVPIRESGSMMPQLLIGALVRSRPIRKWIWSAGSAVQGLALLGMAATASALEGMTGGLMILALLILFSLARGACSVAYKDVLGKTIPKTRRGRLSGWISGLAGFCALAAGASLSTWLSFDNTAVFLGILVSAGMLWFLAAWIYATIVEFPGETGGGIDGFREGLRKVSLLKTDKPFRNFVIARALAMGSGLAAPFYVALARNDLGVSTRFLGIFIAVEGFAALISAPVWGYWADHSSRRVFAVACALAALFSMGVATWSLLDFGAAASTWFYPIAFLGLGIAHAGVRLGRKTYLVDLAEGNRRTDYVAVSNTVIGFLLLISGLVSALAAVLSLEAAIYLLATAGLAGSLLSLRWKKIR